MIESTTIPRKPDSESWSRWKLKKVTPSWYRDSLTKVVFAVFVLVESEVIFKIHDLQSFPFEAQFFQHLKSLGSSRSSLNSFLLVKFYYSEKYYQGLFLKYYDSTRKVCARCKFEKVTFLLLWKWPSSHVCSINSAIESDFLEETYSAFKYFRYCFIVSIFR